VVVDALHINAHRIVGEGAGHERSAVGNRNLHGTIDYLGLGQSICADAPIGGHTTQRFAQQGLGQPAARQELLASTNGSNGLHAQILILCQRTAIRVGLPIGKQCLAGLDGKPGNHRASDYSTVA